MLGKGLVFLSILLSATAIVFQSAPMAIVAGLLGVFGLTTRSFK